MLHINDLTYRIEGRIILDQAWALDAVYAVFDRVRSYRNLQRYRGRFTRSDLGQWIWDAEGYATEEQALFLSLMQQCGICFRLRRGDHGGNIESEYIAPDLLPGRGDPEIASELFLSPKTVETHVNSIFGKLGLFPAPDDHRRVLAVLAFLRS